ncbi:TetR/AcrR family transcriptional regulator [Sphingobacterium spiritivorum]|uniref:Transcriptional regulator, TetR family n=3 Tax=Sphingobacterium spiritivorum TaxID=258 RepID=D7VLH5_SPHSI|nr:TetR/AcrR family transcriptional regulator [Sphingobacterium spiritivorum]EEI94189.1 transcriptional regulator, TetR family [Sphingobacterium spiritivorum ATCC 33300]EFK58448.1 transcriptional regulator, TetR family [Sphingobacterium spiritivorum ATCC 33861]QQS97988.1 TetR/AcrR family transcriptional regulator [Sphingobacterium spiritivorum]QQT37188.1 TetR/AcrR family transcriptional regulator [Sphingobacterium spiritivorum]WQD33968.1 TetR/AcrR family transcriptional regulator [Sphingobacte
MKDNAMSRKERIMKEALALFAEKGYADTSTKIIAQNAEVSEALIFKHFGNKDALLFHLIKSGYRRVLMYHKGMMTYKNPKDFLKNMIFLPSKLVAEEPIFWKLQERLSHNSFSRQQHEQFMKPVQPIINRAFEELGYENPELETQFLLIVIDSLWKKEASGEIDQSLDLAILLEKKYDLL